MSLKVSLRLEKLLMVKNQLKASRQEERESTNLFTGSATALLRTGSSFPTSSLATSRIQDA